MATKNPSSPLEEPDPQSFSLTMATNNLSPLKELPKNPSSSLEEPPKNPYTLEEPPTSVDEEELLEAGNEEAEEEQQGNNNNGDLLAAEGKNESFHEEEIQEANSDSSSVAATPTLKVKAAAAKANKRPIEKNNVVEETVSKRTERNRVVSEKQSGFINRKWSDADEVVILEGLIQFKLMGKDNRSEFYNFIKKSLEFDCNRKQLTDKIIKLKSKYESNVMKGKTQLLDAHKGMCFQLSKKLWGIKGKDSDSDSDSHLVKRKLKYDIDLDEKRLELEKKWAELNFEESQIFLWRCELIAEQTKLVLDAYKASAP